MLAVANISLKVIFIYAFLSFLSYADCLLKELLHKERETENSTNKTINSALKMLFKVVMSASYTRQNWEGTLETHLYFVLTSS